MLNRASFNFSTTIFLFIHRTANEKLLGKLVKEKVHILNYLIISTCIHVNYHKLLETV